MKKQETNIWLLAAAPDLLKACQEGYKDLIDIINAADNGQPYQPHELTEFFKAVDMMYEAIKKAKESC